MARFKEKINMKSSEVTLTEYPQFSRNFLFGFLFNSIVFGRRVFPGPNTVEIILFLDDLSSVLIANEEVVGRRRDHICR